MCSPHPKKGALNNEKCHLCKMQEMSMPACECALCLFLCAHVYIWSCGRILPVWRCVRRFCARVRAYVCVHIDRRRDGGVCRGASVCVDGEAGLLSFNIVLVGHWAICKCTELTAEAQSSLVHPPTSITPNPPSIPPTACLSCLTDSSCCHSKQRHKHRHGPGGLLGAASSSWSFSRWWALNRMEWRGLAASTSTSLSTLLILL